MHRRRARDSAVSDFECVRMAANVQAWSEENSEGTVQETYAKEAVEGLLLDIRPIESNFEYGRCESVHVLKCCQRGRERNVDFGIPRAKAFPSPAMHPPWTAQTRKAHRHVALPPPSHPSKWLAERSLTRPRYIGTE